MRGGGAGPPRQSRSTAHIPEWAWNRRSARRGDGQSPRMLQPRPFVDVYRAFSQENRIPMASSTVDLPAPLSPMNTLAPLEQSKSNCPIALKFSIVKCLILIRISLFNLAKVLFLKHFYDHLTSFNAVYCVLLQNSHFPFCLSPLTSYIFPQIWYTPFNGQILWQSKITLPFNLSQFSDTVQHPLACQKSQRL